MFCSMFDGFDLLGLPPADFETECRMGLTDGMWMAREGLNIERQGAMGGGVSCVWNWENIAQDKSGLNVQGSYSAHERRIRGLSGRRES